MAKQILMMPASHTQSLPEENFFNKNTMKTFHSAVGNILGHLCEIEGRSVASIYSTFM